jgi:hypothetical protein
MGISGVLPESSVREMLGESDIVDAEVVFTQEETEQEDTDE